MDKQATLDKQIEAIKGMGFEVLLGVARSKEPLTYSYISDEGDESQVEAFFTSFSDEELEMVVALDSNSQARFKPQDITKTVHLARN